MASLIGIVILGWLIGMCIWIIFFRVQALAMLHADKEAPTHVSWREIEEPLLYGWEYRFRQSLGPIPEGVEALRNLAQEHKSYSDRYYREARKEQFPRSRDQFDRSMGKSREHMTECIKFTNLYDQEVRKHYLLAPEDPIDLPTKYKLDEDAINHRLPRKGPSNRVYTA